MTKGEDGREDEPGAGLPDGDPLKPDEAGKESGLQLPPWITNSAVWKGGQRWLTALPEPYIERALPNTNNHISRLDSADPWKEVNKIGRSALWIAGMFGVGTFIGQLRGGYSLAQVLKRSLLGGGVGALALVGGGIVRDVNLEWIAATVVTSEELISARFDQVAKQEKGYVGVSPTETPVNENPRPSESKIETNRFEIHETIGPVTCALLIPVYIALFWPTLKWLVLSTRVLTAGVYPYFLMRWLSPADPRIAYSFAAASVRSFTVARAWVFGIVAWACCPDFPNKGLLGKLRVYAFYLLGILLVARTNRAARRYLSHISSDHTVKSSAQYFLDSTRK